jgi:hypothetical protein
MKLLNVMLSTAKCDQILKVLFAIKISGYCYHLDNVISFMLPQNAHINFKIFDQLNGQKLLR